MSKFLLSALLALGVTLVATPAMAKRGADDAAGHVRGGNHEHSRASTGNAGGATGTTNPAGHKRGGNHDSNEANEHAAGHEANEHAAGHEANEHAGGHDADDAPATPAVP